jgi:hypothetical protein
MDREIAQMILMTVARAGNELGNLMPLLKEHGEGAKDDAVRHVIASAVYEIGQIEEQVFKVYPDLREQSEERLNKYGRSYY